MKISYYRCNVSYLNNFFHGSKYIRFSDSKEDISKGIYINSKNELECVDNNNFDEVESKVSIMDVFSIYNSKDGSVIAGNKYGAYKIDENGNYYIFTEKFHFKYLPKDWFITWNEYGKLSTYEFKQMIVEKQYSCEKLDGIKTNKKNEETTNKDKMKLEAISTISKIIAKNTGVSVTKTISYLPKNTFGMLVAISIANILFAILMKNVIFGIVAVWLFITTICARKSEKKVINKEIKIDLENYERLNSMNKLSLEMLGKIKQIENYMTIMRYRGVNEEIILLVEQSINLTVFTVIQDDYYSSNKEEIDERLNEFLDNTLEYVKTSLQNKDMEIYQIKKNLSEDYLKMIDRNSEMFKSITKDLGQLSDIFEEKNEQKPNNEDCTDIVEKKS